MPIELRNANLIKPNLEDLDTVHILGLDLPKPPPLMVGERTQILDLFTKLNRGDIGDINFALRAFCIFTQTLPSTRDHVRYEWLRKQKLDDDEIAEMLSGSVELANAMLAAESSEDTEGNEGAPKGAKTKRKN